MPHNGSQHLYFIKHTISGHDIQWEHCIRQKIKRQKIKRQKIRRQKKNNTEKSKGRKINRQKIKRQKINRQKIKRQKIKRPDKDYSHHAHIHFDFGLAPLQGSTNCEILRNTLCPIKNTPKHFSKIFYKTKPIVIKSLVRCFSNNFATKYFKFYLLTEVVAVGSSDADYRCVCKPSPSDDVIWRKPAAFHLVGILLRALRRE